ncbi:uncharacterized protein ASPGLDRAFT_126650 [Aspergillus glaucus CBS 516.65]|uniref:Zn(2)-C6 fungal-type domain-containing protein n=1 Tax=Aspergillus glaucus CBS 516.65 TaxID=1160497 RepID=A0A1L9VKJ8_ASPGL|nr:hypothetical protein ASPGLDRAFT_126650 [Aspergillus glaucus CBS 516.65]OJJ84447.1 hypothetical protein ASPGLDRAFT_126650 [Aspergillus glaucus CBS 516.65]
MPLGRLQPLSCATCRRRKVRCNKIDPCSNCVKAGIPCVFPEPVRNHRQCASREDVMARLRQLEDTVEYLRHPVTSGANGETCAREETGTEKCPYLYTDPKTALRGHDGKEEFGRLVVEDGCCRYVSNRLWASLSDQIAELHDILEPSSPGVDDELDPDMIHPSNKNHDAFIFGYNSVAQSLVNYHPSAMQLSVLLNAYKQNVAPLLMILHPQTIQKVIYRSHRVQDEISECLLFALCFSAAVSMSPEECELLLLEKKEVVVDHFRFATEQACPRARIMSSKSLTLLQAIVLYLASLRSVGETEFAWTMTSTAVRLAFGLGLHRDGSNFGLEPFEAEMRRRLWWYICVLDVQTAEDLGTDPMLHDIFFDTKLPLNINDEDIYEGMKHLPQERIGCPDMTYFLLQCEIALATRRLTYNPPGNICPGLKNIEDRQSLVQDLEKRLNERYVRHCDPSIPLQWACTKIARIAVAKLWLVIYQPLKKQESIASLPPDTQSMLLSNAVEVIELSHLLQTNDTMARWKWEFQTCVPWYAVAYLLAQLCTTSNSPPLERSWSRVSDIFDQWQRQAVEQNKPLWQPLPRLMAQATASREKQRNEERQAPPDPSGSAFQASETTTPRIIEDPLASIDYSAIEQILKHTDPALHTFPEFSEIDGLDVPQIDNLDIASSGSDMFSYSIPSTSTFLDQNSLRSIDTPPRSSQDYPVCRLD